MTLTIIIIVIFLAVRIAADRVQIRKYKRTEQELNELLSHATKIEKPDNVRELREID